LAQTYEDANKALVVLDELLDLLKHLEHELARLGEPLGKQAVAVDLDQLAGLVAMRQTYRELLRDRLAQAGLARPRRAVQEDDPIPHS